MSGCGPSIFVLLLILPQLPLAAAVTSMGTEFFLGFIDTYNEEFGPVQMEVLISTLSTKNVSVRVAAPLLSWNESVTVNKQQSAKVTLPKEVKGRGIELANRGVYVVADEPVSVYAVTKTVSMTDSYLAFQAGMLGQDYLVVTYSMAAEVMIIATQDDTTVTITFAKGRFLIYKAQFYLPGKPLILSMNKFQTFHIYESAYTNIDFTGLRVYSNKPVAVVSGNQFSAIGTSSYDHLMEMLSPVEMLGTRYYVTHTPNMRQGDKFKIVAVEGDTTVSYGEETYTIRESGHHWEIDVGSTVFRQITSDKAIEVAMFSKSYDLNGYNEGDPSMVVLPAVKMYTNEYSWAAPSYYNETFSSSLSVIIDKTKVAGLVLDGNTNLTWKGRANIEDSDKVNLFMDIPLSEGNNHMLSHTDPAVTFFVLLSGVQNSQRSSYLSLAGIGSVMHRCSITGDPHLTDWGGEKASMALPCAFRAAKVRIANSYFPPGFPKYPEIVVEVMGGNSQEPINGRLYAADICVTPTLGVYTNTFCSGEQLIGNGTIWTNETGDMLQDRVVLDYNATTNEAIFTIKHTLFVLRFRPPNRTQGNSQHPEPGIFIKVPSTQMIYDDSSTFPATLCSALDDKDSISALASKENIHPDFIGIYAMMKHMESNIETGDQDEQCPNFLPKLDSCAKSRRSTAVNECFALAKIADYVRCFVRNRIKPSQAFIDCLDFVCSSGATGCPAMTSYANVCRDIKKHVNLNACQP